MADVKITFHLTPKQKEVLAGFRRFTLWRAGRRGAKTRFAVYKQGKFAITNPNTTNWYVAQETSLLEDEIIPLYESIFHGVIRTYSKSRKCFTLVNGSTEFFKSANSNNSLRGRGLHSLVGEEAVFWQNGHSLFNDTLRPQLADYLAWCLLISSPPSKKCPKGAEWFRRTENIFLEEIKRGNPDYAVFHSTIYDNPYISREEIESIKSTTDPDTWKVEYLGEYNDQVGQVDWEFDPVECKRILTDGEALLFRARGGDWGLSDNTAFVWGTPISGDRIYIYDEHVANNLDVPTHAQIIKRKTPYPVGWTVLDSACWSRDASMTSVAKRFQAQGIPVMPATKDLDGSLSDVKTLFSLGKIIIHPQCTNLLNAIASWQHGTHEPDVHAAFRYLVDSFIRGGKVMPPIRKNKIMTPQEIIKGWQKQDEMNARAQAHVPGRQQKRFTIM